MSFDASDNTLIASLCKSSSGAKTFTVLCIQGQQIRKQQKQARTSRAALVTEAKFGARTKAPTTSYICKDCGYIYDERQPFESLDKSYRCPVCNSPKRR